MAIERKIIGGRVFAIDRENNLLFTKGEIDKARNRFFKEKTKAERKQNGV